MCLSTDRHRMCGLLDIKTKMTDCKWSPYFYVLITPLSRNVRPTHKRVMKFFTRIGFNVRLKVQFLLNLLIGSVNSVVGVVFSF